MAWDYEGFDRQVKTMELVAIYSEITRAAEANVPTQNRNEWNKIVMNVDSSFLKSIIKSTEGVELKVEGGLPSGLYLTSICGDGFNKVFCEASREVLQALGLGRIPDENVDIQGDDTNVMSEKASILQLFDWLLQRSGVKGGNGKFGITMSRTEFLRVSFDEN